MPLGKKAEAKLLIGTRALEERFVSDAPLRPREVLPRADRSAADGLRGFSLPRSAAWASSSSRRRLSPQSGSRGAEPERLAYEASIDYGYPAGFLARYFEKLRYSFARGSAPG